MYVDSVSLLGRQQTHCTGLRLIRAQWGRLYTSISHCIPTIHVYLTVHQYMCIPVYLTIFQYTAISYSIPVHFTIITNIWLYTSTSISRYCKMSWYSGQGTQLVLLQQEAVNTVAAPVYYPSPNVSRPASQLTEEEQVFKRKLCLLETEKKVEEKLTPWEENWHPWRKNWQHQKITWHPWEGNWHPLGAS